MLDLVLVMEDLNAEQGIVLNAIAHELKNPLVIINANVDIIQTNDPDIRKRLNSIRDVSSRLMQTVDSLLVSARPQNNSSEAVLFSVRQQIKSVIVELTPQLEQRQQNVVFRAPKNLHDVFAIPDLTHIALCNLIENASKYSPDKSSISVSIRSMPNTLKILVKDQGPGIAKSEAGKLFTQFGKANAPMSNRPQSTGLGLFIAKRILESMNGQLDYMNVRHGSCFIASLPTTEQMRLF